ncbi:MAG: 6-oxocyclohex-1-ene-1-carbonyl-CoA hydratase [Desulfotomaculaceae bacterium]|nr:6-oxocyclohex-1-ene-1-carbonyl-CoA hydratase [Desulfotomaculaceae bacterium]
MDIYKWPREEGLKNHDLYGDEHFGTMDQAPCVVYEKRPITDPKGNVVEGLYTAWLILNNPKQYNSYTTEMVKGVIAGMHRASMDREVVAVIFTAVGDKAFCTGGNTIEYAHYYSMKPNEYALYMDLFNAMVDAIYMCKKPVICRSNGMRVAGGQEIGMATDITISSDLAIYGQAGPRHGSAPAGGSTDYIMWYLGAEKGMWNCISCEMWSAYKMENNGMITKAVPVLKKDGKFIRNPQVITDKYVEDGAVVYGEMKAGDAAKEARALIKECESDFSLLDAEVNKLVWTLTNLMPLCLMFSIDGIRQKKKYFWDMSKLPNRHWLAANMNGEAYLGFNAFSNKKLTGGVDVCDFIEYRRLQAQGRPFDQDMVDAALPKRVE